MSEIYYTSKMDVEIINITASDAGVIAAAQVSTKGAASIAALDEDPERKAGLIKYLMENRHGTPFEHNSFTFMVSAPIAVFREFQRHRIGFSYNEESGRYKVLDPKFYLPSADRPLVQTGKPGHYTFVAGTDEQYGLMMNIMTDSHARAYADYELMLSSGIAREVARGVLPVYIFSSMYVTCNSRSLMNFLSLRGFYDPTAKFKSFPMHEIALIARELEKAFELAMPITYRAWIEAGKVAP